MQDSELYLFLKKLKHSRLTGQQKRTLKGQALKGDLEGAWKGYYRLVDAKRREVG